MTFTDGSTPVDEETYTIAGHVEAQLYHFPPSVGIFLDRFVAVDVNTCEPIYDSNAYIGPDYLGRCKSCIHTNSDAKN